MSESGGGGIVLPAACYPAAGLGSRHGSYTSHLSRISYTSHGDLIAAGRPCTLLPVKPPDSASSQFPRHRHKHSSQSIVPEVVLDNSRSNFVSFKHISFPNIATRAILNPQTTDMHLCQKKGHIWNREIF
jgi:hypothetical protein